jgi:putative resolvase
MKAKEVLKLLNISRTTLYNYTKDGLLKTTKLDNGYYDYDEDSVFKVLKKDNRQNIIYARVSTYKQKNDLQNQISYIKDYCQNNNIIIHNIYTEIESGIDLDRPEFNKLLDDVLNLKIKNIYISNKDRLTRLSFKTLQFLFSKFGTNIIIINDNPNNSNDNEIFEELINLMHIFSMSMYSNRRKNKTILFKNDIENFLSTD